jgi:hypothetical protein
VPNERGSVTFYLSWTAAGLISDQLASFLTEGPLIGLRLETLECDTQPLSLEFRSAPPCL